MGSGRLFFHTRIGNLGEQVKKAEKDVLHKMLENYFLHLLKNPDTLLCLWFWRWSVLKGTLYDEQCVLEHHSNKALCNA